LQLCIKAAPAAEKILTSSGNKKGPRSIWKVGDIFPWEKVMAHLVNLWADDQYVAVPTVTYEVGPKIRRHADDVSLVNNLLRLVYFHHPPAGWPGKSLPPKNGHYTRTTDLFVCDWQKKKMGLPKAGGLVSPVPPTDTLGFSCASYTIAGLARAAVMLMDFDGDPDGWLTLIAELKKAPLLAHLDATLVTPPSPVTSEAAAGSATK